jgi:dTDP-4-dehydrorhamnose 3,5-epimerase
MILDVIDQPMGGLVLIQPKIFSDDRGYFLETFSDYDINELFHHKLKLTTPRFVQENESLSKKSGVLRGLHLQLGSSAQGKMVRVVSGEVLDVVVDLRPNSKTFGEHFSVVLNDTTKMMMYIPPGFAHGFLTLEDNTLFNYKCTNYYDKSSECCIRYDDEDLNINWGVDLNGLTLSEKDLDGISFKEYLNIN